MTKVYLTPEMADGRFGASVEAEVDVSLSRITFTGMWQINGVCSATAIHATDGTTHRRTTFSSPRVMMHGDVFSGRWDTTLHIDPPAVLRGPPGPPGPSGPMGMQGCDGRDGRDADDC